MDQLIALVIDEGKWLPASLGLALLSIVMLLFRYRRSLLPVRQRILATMNLFFGVTIGTMAFGHILAITTKLLMGTLAGSILTLYAIGLILAVPSWWIVYHTRELLSSEDRGRKTMLLNASLATALLALGIPNLPLAVPAFLNIAYDHHSRRLTGWVIVAISILVQGGLLIGSLIFMASGQSFEQFNRME